MFVPAVNDTRYPGLQGSLLHDTIADSVTSVDWATVSAIRLNVDCGVLDKTASFNAWGEIHQDDGDQYEAEVPDLGIVPSIHGMIGNDTGPGPDSIMVSIDLPIPPNEWSEQWSVGGPDALHIQTRYARSPYGPGPSVNSSNSNAMAWSTQPPPSEYFLALSVLKFEASTQLCTHFGIHKSSSHSPR